MPLRKSQMRRMMKIVVLLKENRYPNSETPVKELRSIVLKWKLEIKCGKKTRVAGQPGRGGGQRRSDFHALGVFHTVKISWEIKRNYLSRFFLD